MKCSFCNRAEKQTTILIAGPPPNCICDDCSVAIAKGFLEIGEKTGSHEFNCSFCGAKKSGPIGAVMGHEARIYESCIAICLGILEEQLNNNHMNVIEAYKQKFLPTQSSM